MANQEHLDILKQGVEKWNKWRKEHADIQPDLSRAHLGGVDYGDADFRGVNFRSAYFNGANLDGVDLSGADLGDADLTGADLTKANLTDADLSGATLGRANLTRANLTGANLTNVILGGTDLSGATLDGANLRGAIVGFGGRTVFGGVDLSVVKELDTVKHWGPSTIGIDTIYYSHGNISEAFLKGAGVDDTFITYIRSLVGMPIEYYSCFISYLVNDLKPCPILP